MRPRHVVKAVHLALQAREAERQGLNEAPHRGVGVQHLEQNLGLAELAGEALNLVGGNKKQGIALEKFALIERLDRLEMGGLLAQSFDERGIGFGGEFGGGGL